MSDVLTYIDFNTSDSILPGKYLFTLIVGEYPLLNREHVRLLSTV